MIGEIQDKLRKNHNFYEGNNELYESSPLKRIISRFEYILNTYLREFVDLSIKDWVEFIKLFTSPSLNNDELWKMNEHPFVVIHLSIKKKEKKKKDKKKKEEKKKDDKAPEGAAPEEKEVEESDEDDKNRVIYKPSIEDCQEYVLSSMEMVIDSTNSVNGLESDLMPFLQKKSNPNFPIDQNFPWISGASEHLSTMIDENVEGPKNLLDDYKKYEYILNVDKKQLVDDLFKGAEDGGKVPLEEIKAQIEHYDKAHYEIMTLSEDEVDFRIFRVMSKKLKSQLGDKAMEWKTMILDATYSFCTESVANVFKIYNEMQEKILHDPINEKELIASKDFIAEAPATVERLTEELKEVYRHYMMLEEFSYMYKELDIESFWYMKVWPLKIQACLTDGKNMQQEKNDLFSAKLEAEKESFTKQITTYQQNFEKIKDFTKLDQVQDLITATFELKKNIDTAHNTVVQFHDRETTFGLPETPYPDLDDIDKSFKPFFDLITMSHEVKQLLREWTEERLMTRDTEAIFSSISQWQSSCFQLYKKLNEDYPDTAEVAQDLRGQIEQFSKNLPLIKAFTSEAILEEDWKEIQQLVSTVVTGPFERDEIKV